MVSSPLRSLRSANCSTGSCVCEDEDEGGPAVQGAVDAELDGRAARADDAGVDEADEGDEEADADRDRRAQRLGDGLEDGRAEAGEHEDGDDDALPDHEAHGLRPGLLRREGEGDERVEPEAGAAAIGAGEADFIAMGRKLLADPELPNKLLAGQPEAIRPCIYCYACVSEIFVNRGIKCAVNAQTGHESTAPIAPILPRAAYSVVSPAMPRPTRDSAAKKCRSSPPPCRQVRLPP